MPGLVASVLAWWAVGAVIAVGSLPIATRALGRLWDQGYAASRVIGILVVSYAAYTLSTIHVLPYGPLTLWLLLLAWIGANVAVALRDGGRFLGVARRSWRGWFVMEAVFLVALAVAAFVRGHNPDIHDIEKFMDYGFMASVQRTTWFPAADMWFAGEPINYYYFGQVVLASRAALTPLGLDVGYNMALSGLFATVVVQAASLGGTIAMAVRERVARAGHAMHPAWALVGASLAAFFVAMRGNGHWFAFQVNKVLGVSWLPDASGDYWYAEATRYIQNPSTIHEFPVYSFLLGDLHAQIVNFPMTLLLLAATFCVILRGRVKWVDGLVAGALLGVFWMSNVWDVPIYLLLLGVVWLVLSLREHLVPRLGAGVLWAAAGVVMLVAYTATRVFAAVVPLQGAGEGGAVALLTEPLTWITLVAAGAVVVLALRARRDDADGWWATMQAARNVAVPLAIAFGLLVLVSLPFTWFYDAPFNGVYPVTDPSPIVEFLTIWSWDLWMVASVLLVTTGLLVRERAPTTRFDQAMWGMTAVGLFVILIPELAYVKDIYPTHPRANTMWKLVEQAWVFLSLGATYAAVRLLATPTKWHWPHVSAKAAWAVILAIGIVVTGAYTAAATDTRYRGLEEFEGLDGTNWITDPNERAAIKFLRGVEGTPTIVEAVGDSYTDRNLYSTFTGLPAVIGWMSHQWIWRGDSAEPFARSNEVRAFYETTDRATVEAFLDKYDVEYIIIGPRERAEYPNLRDNVIGQVADIAFQDGGVRIFQVRG